MSELEEKLENILGNPQAMAQIMSLAQSLSGKIIHCPRAFSMPVFLAPPRPRFS